MASYIAKIRASGNLPLIGGVYVHTSSRFETFEMAWHWLYAVVAVNMNAGRKIGGTEVYQTQRDAEIVTCPKTGEPTTRTSKGWDKVDGGTVQFTNH